MSTRSLLAALLVLLLAASVAIAASLSGTNRRDSIRGTNRADVVRAKNGNDVVRAGRGNDRLYGQRGNDRLYGQAGNDRVYGQAGNDVLVGGPGRDVLVGGAGNDRITGGPGRDVIRCGGGRDIVNADVRDRVARDCEVVRGRRTVGGGGSGGGAGGGTTQPAPAPAAPGLSPPPAASPADQTTESILATLRGFRLTLIDSSSGTGSGSNDRSDLDLCSDGSFGYRREYGIFSGGISDAGLDTAQGTWSIRDVKSIQDARLAFANQTGTRRTPGAEEPFQLPESVAIGFVSQGDGSVQTFVDGVRVFRTQSPVCT